MKGWQARCADSLRPGRQRTGRQRQPETHARHDQQPGATCDRKSRQRTCPAARTTAAAPAIRANYLDTENDRSAIVAAFRRDGKFSWPRPATNPEDGVSAGAAGAGDEQILDYVRSEAESVYHPVGTCKMGSDSMAVVDERLRARRAAPARRGRVHHADHCFREHQRASHHDRREMRGHAAADAGVKILPERRSEQQPRRSTRKAAATATV
ncbi:MAG: hypothetical protein IPG06_00420 [Haliea sp.]|nr:hypothetical protein [Haliea sp.]